MSPNRSLAVEDLTFEEFNNEIEKGLKTVLLQYTEQCAENVPRIVPVFIFSIRSRLFE